MSKTGQEDGSKSTKDDSRRNSDQELARNNWRLILIVFTTMVFACFAVWLVTASFPAGDTQRGRVTVPLKNGRTLIVDYPRRYPADDSDRIVYLTADSLESMSITIELPPSLPLILSSTVPSSTIRMDNSSEGRLIVTWPTPTVTATTTATVIHSNTQPALVTSTPALDQTTRFTQTEIATTESVAPTSVTGVAASLSLTQHLGASESSSPAAKPDASPSPSSISNTVGVVPVISQPHTISLYFKNSGSLRSPFPPLPFVAGIVNDSFKIGDAVKNQDIPVEIETTDRANWRIFAKEYSFLVILPTIITALGFFYKSYTDQHKVQQQRAEAVLGRFKQAISESIRDDVEKTWNDLDHCSKYLSSDDLERSRRLYQFSLGTPTIADEETRFNTWTDAWAGALMLAHKSKQLDKETTFRYIRTFPADQLSRTGEQRFRGFVADLDLPQPQPHEWPTPAESPVGYSTDAPKSISDLRLFPGLTADNLEDRKHLFSEAQWFWREHPTYSTAKLSSKSALVCGKAGCGRTALALALTRYAETEERVLGSYHSRSATLSEAQQNLAQELLHFLRWRSTWLTKLTQEDRDLLAMVFSNTMDSSYVLSVLSAHEPDQFISTDTHKAIWEEQAIVELRLLRQSFEQIQGKHPLPPTQWFEALSRCAKKMDFQQLRIALDLTIEQYETWRIAHLWQILSALPSNSEAPVQLIVLAPGQAENFDVRAVGMDVQKLEWLSSPGGREPPLVQLLRYRLMKRINTTDDTVVTEFVPEGVQRALCNAARHNPRRLAQLWRHIATMNPDKKSMTIDMVSDAETAIP